MHRLVQVVVGVRDSRGRGGDPLEVGALDPSVAEMARGEVHDRPVQVRPEDVRLAQVPQATDEANEGVLHEVLGQGTVAGQEEGEAKSVGRVGDVELRERPAFDDLPRHLAHHRPFCRLTR